MGWSLGKSALAVGATVMAFSSFAGSPASAADRSYILSTATTGGTYYPVGVALATLVKVKLEPRHKIQMSAISSAGSGENVKLLREGQAQFAILQGLFGAWAWTGTGDVKADGPQKHLRSMSMLWRNVEQFVIRADLAKTGTVMDLATLKDQPFSIGARNSGTEGSGRTILGNLGIDVDGTFKVVYLGYNPTADALQNGTVVAANLTGGVPVSAITQAFANMGDKLRILDYTPEQITKSNGDLGQLWVPFTIPANSYPGQTKEVKTAAQPNFLALHQNVDEEAVYLITKTIYENLGFLQNIHKATNEMSLEAATGGLPFPLHPGALRYYREAGHNVPAHLIAN